MVYLYVKEGTSFDRKVLTDRDGVLVCVYVCVSCVLNCRCNQLTNFLLTYAYDTYLLI